MDKETQICLAEMERKIQLLWDRLENLELQVAYMTQEVAPNEEPFISDEEVGPFVDLGEEWPDDYDLLDT